MKDVTYNHERISIGERRKALGISVAIIIPVLLVVGSGIAIVFWSNPDVRLGIKVGLRDLGFNVNIDDELRAGPAAAQTPPPLTNPTSNEVAVEFSHRWNWSESGNFFHIEGQLRNVSGRRLEGVRIVLTFFDKSRNFVTSDIAYPEYDPLMPGQATPYKSMSAANPVIESYNIEIATRDGRTLLAKEIGPPKKARK